MDRILSFHFGRLFVIIFSITFVLLLCEIYFGATLSA